MIDPKEQYQIGDKVLWKKHGIFSTVTGYRFVSSRLIGAILADVDLAGYELDIGVTVEKNELEKVK